MPRASTIPGPIRRVIQKEVTRREVIAAKASPAKPHRMMPAIFAPSIFLNMPMSSSGRPTAKGSIVQSTAHELHNPVAAQN